MVQPEVGVEEQGNNNMAINLRQILIIRVGQKEEVFTHSFTENYQHLNQTSFCLVESWDISIWSRLSDWQRWSLWPILKALFRNGFKFSSAFPTIWHFQASKWKNASGENHKLKFKCLGVLPAFSRVCSNHKFCRIHLWHQHFWQLHCTISHWGSIFTCRNGTRSRIL